MFEDFCDVCELEHVWNCLYYKWEYWLWVLCSYFYWVIKALMWSDNYCFGMHAYVWWLIRSTISWEEEEGCLLCPFLKIEKTALMMGKNALIVFIHGLNVHLCSYLKYYFKSSWKEKLWGFLPCFVDEMFIEMPLF